MYFVNPRMDMIDVRGKTTLVIEEIGISGSGEECLLWLQPYDRDTSTFLCRDGVTPCQYNVPNTLESLILVRDSGPTVLRNQTIDVTTCSYIVMIGSRFPGDGRSDSRSCYINGMYVY